MQQSTSCRREDEWGYGDNGRQWWRMMTVADKDDTRDWAVDCDGEGQERAVRDGGDSRVVMMVVAAEDGGSGGGWQRWTMTAADNNGMQDWVAEYKEDRQEWAARDDGDTEWQ
jgi:hypothetical protein